MDLKSLSKQKKTPEEKQAEKKAKLAEKTANKSIKLHTLSWDEPNTRYILNTEEKKFGELPAEAVHVTGKKNEYLLDTIGIFNETDYGYDATDLNLWMVNNDINEALAGTGSKSDVDLRKLVVYGIIGIVAVMIVYAFM